MSDVVTFTEEIFNGKLLLCCVMYQYDAFYRSISITTVSSLPPSSSNLKYMLINTIQHRSSVPNNLLQISITQYVDVSIFIKPNLPAFKILSCSEPPRLLHNSIILLGFKGSVSLFDWIHVTNYQIPEGNWIKPSMH